MKQKLNYSAIIFFFVVFQTHAQQWNGGSTPETTITRAGSVGIGTLSSIDYKFQVNGSVTVKDVINFYHNPSSSSGLVGNLSFRNYANGNDGVNEIAAIKVFNASQDYNSKMNFYTRSGGSAQLRMTIDPYGNVGIGTTNTTDYKLSVGGKIRAAEVKVYTGWADFVFEEDYALRSLNEVEQYIKTHKHLPDIPSAAEVEENGVQLGDISAKLLQKIEELTLYVIEQEKDIENLKNENKVLKDKVIMLEK